MGSFASTKYKSERPQGLIILRCHQARSLLSAPTKLIAVFDECGTVSSVVRMKLSARPYGDCLLPAKRLGAAGTITSSAVAAIVPSN